MPFHRFEQERNERTKALAANPIGGFPKQPPYWGILDPV